MRKRLLLGSTLLLLALGALAANAHFLGSPTITTNNNRTITVCGTIAGLGNQDVTVVVAATATTTCTNRGSNVPPGLTQTVSGSISNLHPDNGRVSFCVTTAQAGNPCTDGMRPQTTFSNVSVKVFQGGNLVLQQTF
jgi:hypothetical protein